MELKTSPISHPPNNEIVIRREWVTRAVKEFRKEQRKSQIKENAKYEKREECIQCCAEILALMEYHLINQLANTEFQAMLKTASKVKGGLRETNGWMPYPHHYIESCLLGGRGRDVIQKSLTLLEDMGFIKSNVPKDIRLFYNSRREGWYKMQIEVINNWIDKHYDRHQTVTDMTKPVITPKIEPKIEPVLTTPRQQIVNAICAFHAHIHNKSSKYIYSESRKKGIIARITEGRTLPQLAQAIIGCVVSPHHQGNSPKTNPENIIYDDIDLIMRSTEHFDRFIKQAEMRKVTEQVAIGELEKCLKGQTSHYAKGRLKEAETVLKSPIEPRYHTFATVISSFFTGSDVIPLAEIMQLVFTNERLKNLSKGLTDEVMLVRAITAVVKTFKGDDESALSLIQGFAKALTEMEKING